MGFDVFWVIYYIICYICKQASENCPVNVSNHSSHYEITRRCVDKVPKLSTFVIIINFHLSTRLPIN